MDDLCLPAVAARLVAWHNRHPLARRITAQQVHAIGYVALPCAAAAGAGAVPPTLDDVVEAGGGSLRERAQARARHSEAAPPEPALDRRALTPRFSEHFIDPLTPRQVARFAVRAGRVLARAPADGPVRQVRADAAHLPQGAGGAVVQVYLLTAVIETGTRKSRVLLGGGDHAQVLGQRIFGTQRLAAVVAPLALLGGALLMPALRAAPPAQAIAQAQTQAASAPQVGAAAPVPASGAEPAQPAQPAQPVHGASAPIDVEPRLGRIELPDLRAQVTRVSRDNALRAPAAPPQPAADGASAAVAAVPTPPLPPRTAPTPPTGPAYAVSTRALRTRAEADQVRVAMVSLLKTVAADGVHVDVLPEGEDWRVVGLPFAGRAAADQARALLVSRGMRVQVLGF